MGGGKLDTVVAADPDFKLVNRGLVHWWRCICNVEDCAFDQWQIGAHSIQTIAAGTIRITKEPGTTNIADLFTKLMGGSTYSDMIKRCMW